MLSDGVKDLEGRSRVPSGYGAPGDIIMHAQVTHSWITTYIRLWRAQHQRSGGLQSSVSPEMGMVPMG
jgi:hypothetical protein